MATAAAAIRIPLTTVSAVSGPGRGAFSFPLPIVTGSSTTPEVSAAGNLILPLMGVDGNSAAQGQIQWPLILVAGSGFVTASGVGSVLLPRYVVIGTGAAGQQGLGDLSVPLLTISATGVQSARGVGAIVRPLFAIEGIAFNEVNDTILYRTVVVNPRHAAVTEFLNFNFESFCEFPPGVFLAVDEAGNLYQLYSTSGTDNGTLINAELQFGTTEFGADTNKNCVDAFINCRGDGSSILEALVDEAQDPNSGEEAPDVYVMRGMADGRLRNFKFKMSRKREGRNWRFSLKNVNGSYLDVNEVAVFYDILSRRV